MRLTFKKHRRRMLSGVQSLAVLAALVVAFFLVVEAHAETVNVKYRGPVDLRPFQCQDVTRSSLVRRVCYDRALP
jgi:hypothetical protein